MASFVEAQEHAADYALHIKATPIEIAANRIVSAITYNGVFRGPLLRVKEGGAATVDIFNDTDTTEQLHWHGQRVGTDVDGAAEEGTPFIPAGGKRWVTLTNGRMLGHGEPLRVKQGERVLFHVLNGSATEIRSLALPGMPLRSWHWMEM
jgi:FtsP/CotA-like multicopper oxidase with cupredoxin domain